MTPKEAKDCFRDIDRHRVLFTYSKDTDDEIILTAFSKENAEQCKVWMIKYMEECIDRKFVEPIERIVFNKKAKEISCTSLINRELVQFAGTDNIRSITCMVDGLKPGQ